MSEYTGCSLLCNWKVGVHFEKSNRYLVSHIISIGTGYLNPDRQKHDECVYGTEHV